MTRDDFIETMCYVAVVAPAVVGFAGLAYHWNVYTCVSLIIGSFVLLVTYEFSKG